MTLLCPRCRVDLEERSADELVIHGCRRCGGVWLDRTGVARIGEALSSKTLAAVDAVASAASHLGDEARPIDCPQCAEILIRTPVPKAGVAIDRCPDHGAWYDRNELQQVARALGTAPPAGDEQPPHKPTGPKSGPKSAPSSREKKARPPATVPAPPPPAPAPLPAPVTTRVQDSPSTLLNVAGLIIDVALSFF